MIYIGDMKRYRQKYFLYTVYNNKQIGGIMEYRYHKISCCGHNGVWTRIQRDMDITKMNKIPQNCSENRWCQIESVYQEASDSPRLNQERHGCDLQHTELSAASLGRRLSWMRHLSWLLLFRRRNCTCDLAAAEPLCTVTKSRACHATQLRRPAARAYRESPSAAPATRDTARSSVQRLYRESPSAAPATRDSRGVKHPEALQRVTKCRACHAKPPRRQRGPRRPETTESHQVPRLPRKAAAASSVQRTVTKCRACQTDKLIERRVDTEKCNRDKLTERKCDWDRDGKTADSDRDKLIERERRRREAGGWRSAADSQQKIRTPHSDVGNEDMKTK